MGSLLIAILLPNGDLGTGIGQRREQPFVWELVAEPPIEALDEAILDGFSRCDVVPADGRALAPGRDRHRSERGSIVGNHSLGAAASGDDLIELAHHPGAGTGGGGGTGPFNSGGAGAGVGGQPQKKSLFGG